MAGPSEKMDAFIARFDELTPTDFTRFSKDYTPDGTDVYTLTGRAVDKIPPIPVDHGFYMSINNVAAGKGSPLHRHVQPEMFVVLSGDWTFFWAKRGRTKSTWARWIRFLFLLVPTRDIATSAMPKANCSPCSAAQK